MEYNQQMDQMENLTRHLSSEKQGGGLQSFHESLNEFRPPQKNVTVMQSTNFNKENVRPERNEVQTSCPASVFKNYSNVFAEITKNVIGEIEESEVESDQLNASQQKNYYPTQKEYAPVNES